MTMVTSARRRTFGIAAQVLIAVFSIAATALFVYVLLHQHPAERARPSVQPPATIVVAPH
ncbi:hypothetical protein [Nocardia pseudobrasiliensis]|uniref:Uncharacterized protein n=1 Tax=Nocardia pseudobrasiliensis TaxID=45979 RepID=A0A370I0M9_9NOCA|nr:hypothetical protein [Nocardia pseudobrasiliensis]RDI64297.1 hypothetical protein DFR76_108129 [Nocardia pseudobrasiliensis]